MEDVPYTYTVMVPETTMQQQTRSYYVCTPKTVTSQVPVTKCVAVACSTPAVDATCGTCAPACDTGCAPAKAKCGLFGRRRGGFDAGCGTAVSACAPAVTYQTVTEMQTITQTVYERELKTDVVNVPVTTCKPETRTVMRKVCKLVPETREVMVNVTTCKPEVRKGTRQVTVCEESVENRTVSYCELVPYTETIQVPVSNPCVDACAPACHTGYSNGGKVRGGLFSRKARGGCGGC